MRALPRVVAIAVMVWSGRAGADPLPQVSIKGPAAVLLVIDDAAADPPKLEPGDSVAIADLVAITDWREAFADLDRAFADAGVKLIDSSETGDQVIRTVALPGGARATLVHHAQGGWITLTPRPRRIRAPGKCVAIPAVAEVIHRTSRGISDDGESHESETELGLATARLFDLDGDAVLDAFVPVADKLACPDEASWQLYAVRGTCGHLVGTVGPGYVSASTERHSGFLDVTTASQSVGMGTDHIPVMTNIDTRFVYRAGVYHKARRTRRAGRCHHCSSSSCSR